MLFINHRSNAQEAKDYFTRHMERSDYYLRDAQEVPGEWHGLGAELLGLSGTVDKERYFALCDNRNPQTGERLTPHTKDNRRILYDFTWDAPKSVSLAFEVGGDHRILGEFRGAVQDTMGEMEALMKTRVRAGGRDETRTTANLVWGEFIHRTARPVGGIPDPQLHCHAVAFNATYDPVENKWKAGEFSGIMNEKAYFQSAFHSRLAERLKKLGYGIERDGNSFRLTGIDPAIAKKFSRRTEVIEAEAKRLGITDAGVKSQLGQRTREAKDPESLPMSRLQTVWKSRLTDEERDAIANARFGQESTSPNASDAMDFALSHCLERASVVPEKQLLKTALIQSVGNASVSEIHEQLKRENVIGRIRGGIKYTTTKDVLREELTMTAFVRDGRGKYAKLGGAKAPELDPALSQEQRDAAELILASRDRVTALRGGAGTGKTRMMQATVAAIEKNGTEVFTFAPSAEASRGVLRSEGFANAETVERLLIDPEMQSKVKNQLLWVDEAGLLSVKDMKRLFDVAKEQNARIVLAGDTAQHNAVYRGDALRILENDAGMKTAELKQIRRQTNERYREAVKAISEGGRIGKDGRTRLEAGVAILDSMGAIVETSGDDRYRQIAADYVAATKRTKPDGKPMSALVVSPTHKEAERVTVAIRDTLRAEGRLAPAERNFTVLRPLNLTEAERQDAREFAPGTVVQFHQNAKGFKRGERLKILGIDKAGVHAQRADGSDALLPLQEAKRFQLYREEQIAFAKGDQLRITQNGLVARETRGGGMGSKAKDRLNNGAIYEVEGFTRQGDIRLTNGTVIPKNYGGIGYGYAGTSHSSQGKTVDTVLIALGQESFAAANKEMFYVATSRGRSAVQLYTDDKAAMLDAVRGSAARLSASELMAEKRATAKARASVMQRLFRVQEIQRAYRAVRERVAASWNVQPSREGQSHAGVER